ncbi:MAG: class I SAM-dependent methyltransferase [Bacteroidales bacterium]|nr:class I SAM-dependent methyltransferase [Bacteroidales bacterium]
MDNHFDIQAKEWDNDPSKIERAKVFADQISGFIKQNNNLRALEFGCGTGALSFQLKDFFKAITLADSSQGMIDVLNAKIKQTGITNFFPLKIDEDNNIDTIGNFDVIYTSMTMHHVLDIEEVITKFNSILTPKGYLCIADLEKEDGSFHDQHPNFIGHNGFHREELTTILNRCGFVVEYYNVCFAVKKELKEYPVFMMICRKKDL